MSINGTLTAWSAEVHRTSNDKKIGTTLIASTFIFLNFLIFLYALCVLCVSITFSAIQRFSRIAIVVIAPLLMAAMWMDKQPSYKPYQAPVLLPPAGSVPVTGREIDSQDPGMKNPFPPTPTSLEQGKALFAINCAMCHGQTSGERGPVGKKFKPQPPGLDHDMVQARSDAHIFKAITFGFGRMPPFKDKLSPDERWNLVNFLRTRK